jgi:1,2-phenylacetyl-CoA epoxidase catalytic subunit
MANQSSNYPKTSLIDKRFSRLLDLLIGVNESIEICKKRQDEFGIRQYEHLKKQYVKEMIELLAEMKVSVQAVEDVQIKEAA